MKNIMEFFHTGSLTMSNLLYLELYLPQNDSILLPFNPMKSWLTLTDLGSRVFFAKSVRWKSFLRKRYVNNMSPELFCYVNFSTDFIKFPLGRGSVSSESCLKMVLENLVPRFFFLIKLFSIKMSNLIIWGIENLRLTKYEEKKSVAGEKDRKCDKWILHVSY